MTDWKSFLARATRRVQGSVRDVKGSDRRRVLGAGASGDKTLVADRRAEDSLVEELSNLGVRIVSEERGEVGDRNAELVAVLDPLDGSSNFERGIPFFCTSVAIVAGGELNGVICGAVRNLVNGDFYYAEKGKGATKNGKRIMTSKITSLSEAVITVDMCRARQETIAKLAPLIASVKRQVHLGANALELCMLAEGSVDSFVDVRGRMRITDFAAAYLIAVEAGALVTDQAGGRLNPSVDLGARFGFVASCNRLLHNRVLDLVCQ